MAFASTLRRSFSLFVLGLFFAFSPAIAQQQLKTISLPADENHPDGFAFTGDGNSLILWYARRVIDVWDIKTGTRREIYDGSFSDIYISPHSNLLVLVTQISSNSELIFLDDLGMIHYQYSLPPDHQILWAQWSLNGSAFDLLRAELSSRAGGTYSKASLQTVIQSIRVGGFQSSEFPVPEATTQFWYSHAESLGLICLTHSQGEEDSPSVSAVYDSFGKSIALTPDFKHLCVSEGRRYYDEYPDDAEMSFRILDARTHQVLHTFRSSDPTKLTGYSAGEWNPQNDDLLVLEHSSESKEDPTYSIFSVSTGRTLHKISGSDYAWSSDGKKLAVIQNHKIFLIPIGN